MSDQKMNFTVIEKYATLFLECLCLVEKHILPMPIICKLTEEQQRDKMVDLAAVFFETFMRDGRSDQLSDQVRGLVERVEKTVAPEEVPETVPGLGNSPEENAWRLNCKHPGLSYLYKLYHEDSCPYDNEKHILLESIVDAMRLSNDGFLRCERCGHLVFLRLFKEGTVQEFN